MPVAKSSLHPLLAAIVALTITIVAVFGFRTIIHLAPSKYDGFVYTALIYVAALPFVLLALRILDYKPFTHFRFSYIALGMGVGLAALYADGIVTKAMMSAGVGGFNNTDSYLQGGTMSASYGWFFLFAITLAPLFEELVFRGVIFAALSRFLTPFGGLIASAMLFGFAHQPGTIAIVGAVIMGLFLGAMRWRTGSLWPGIVAHVFVNFMASLQAQILQR